MQQSVILPPPDLRAIVDKTAAFVAKNGPSFEDRIRETEKANPKFAFLNLNDPYRIYYDQKLVEFREGKSVEKEEGKPKKKRYYEQEEVIPVEPPALEFILDLPPITNQDLDVVKLTALFVARNGRTFMTCIQQKEQRNYQFDFLRPNHSLFPIFTRLVDQYTKILTMTDELKLDLEKNAKDKYHPMERIMQRVEYAQYNSSLRQKEDAAKEKERIAYASVDWHDFMIVDTISFTDEDAVASFPPPLAYKDFEQISLAQRVPEPGQTEAVDEELRSEEPVVKKVKI